MNTVSARILPLSLTSIPDIPAASLIRMISLLMMTVSQSVKWAYACIKMDMKPPNTGLNTVAQKPTVNADASVNTHVLRLNTAEPYISLPTTIQGYLTYRQGTLMHGKRNMAEELPWNAPTNARKKTIN